MEARKLAQLCRKLAENKKAENVTLLDVRGLCSITDYFVIACGTSEPHLRAIRDEITEKLSEDYDIQPRAVDGSLHAAWVVLDFLDVIVHLMRLEVRERYDLEGLWADAPRVKPSRGRRSRTVTDESPAA